MQERVVDADKCGDAKPNEMTTIRIDKLITDDINSNTKWTGEFSLGGIFINNFSHSRYANRCRFFQFDRLLTAQHMNRNLIRIINEVHVKARANGWFKNETLDFHNFSCDCLFV
jgi:hypothetical protein